MRNGGDTSRADGGGMTDDYVTNSAWLALASRPDTIDEIADQFERPRPGAEAFWTRLHPQRAAREARIAPRQLERRAG